MGRPSVGCHHYGCAVHLKGVMRPRTLSLLVTFGFFFLGVAACFPCPAPQNPPANRHAVLIEEFQNRVAQYVKLHKQIATALPPLKSTASSQKLAQRQRLLAQRISAARSQAKQGAIFSPAISAEFRRLIRIAMQGNNAGRIRASLKERAPPGLRIRVNKPYPETAALPSTPPTLLLNLPKLPPEMDYHLVGRDLVLRDVTADLVVDLIPAAIP